MLVGEKLASSGPDGDAVLHPGGTRTQLEYWQSVLMLPTEQVSVPLVQVMVSAVQLGSELFLYSVRVVPLTIVPPPSLAFGVQLAALHCDPMQHLFLVSGRYHTMSPKVEVADFTMRTLVQLVVL